MKRAVLLFVVSVSVWCAPKDYNLVSVVSGYKIDVNGRKLSYDMWKLSVIYEDWFERMQTTIDKDAEALMYDYELHLIPRKYVNPYSHVPNETLSPNVIAAMHKYGAILSRTIYRATDGTIHLVYNLRLAPKVTYGVNDEFATYVYELEEDE